MDIRWRDIYDCDEKLINEWLSKEKNDRKMLCMEQKSWQQTAKDIEECLKDMPDSQFRNKIGYCENIPVCVIMFGVEFSGKLLRIYNILVNPNYRELGIGKQALKDVFSKQNKFKLNRTFSTVVGAVYPENKSSIRLVRSVGLNIETQNDEFIDFSCSIDKINEKDNSK